MNTMREWSCMDGIEGFTAWWRYCHVQFHVEYNEDYLGYIGINIWFRVGEVNFMFRIKGFISL